MSLTAVMGIKSKKKTKKKTAKNYILHVTKFICSMKHSDHPFWFTEKKV